MSLPPCDGNCQYGDAGMGPYDGCKCGCVKCPFYIACETWQPPWVLRCYEGMCSSCAMGPPTIVTKSEMCKVCKARKDTFIKPAGWRGKALPCVDCYRTEVRPFYQ